MILSPKDQPIESLFSTPSACPSFLAKKPPQPLLVDARVQRSRKRLQQFATTRDCARDRQTMNRKPGPPTVSAANRATVRRRPARQLIDSCRRLGRWKALAASCRQPTQSLSSKSLASDRGLPG